MNENTMDTNKDDWKKADTNAGNTEREAHPKDETVDKELFCGECGMSHWNYVRVDLTVCQECGNILEEKKLPTVPILKGSYGQYKSDNYAGHTLQLIIGTIVFYFSYDTVVAFADNDPDDPTDLVVCDNVWSMTTGKHLNWIDGGNKKARLPYKEFKQELNKLLAKHGFKLPLQEL